uniref:Secreted protein n=1 Tax=Panagrellus redivivus TaxID=6233 RepID=A0A7E4VEZ3_PANRE
MRLPISVFLLVWTVATLGFIDAQEEVQENSLLYDIQSELEYISGEMDRLMFCDYLPTTPAPSTTEATSGTDGTDNSAEEEESTPPAYLDRGIAIGMPNAGQIANAAEHIALLLSVKTAAVKMLNDVNRLLTCEYPTTTTAFSTTTAYFETEATNLSDNTKTYQTEPSDFSTTTISTAFDPPIYDSTDARLPTICAALQSTLAR